MAKFTPAPTKMVNLVNERGQFVKKVPMNRAQRRKAGLMRKR